MEADSPQPIDSSLTPTQVTAGSDTTQIASLTTSVSSSRIVLGWFIDLVAAASILIFLSLLLGRFPPSLPTWCSAGLSYIFREPHTRSIKSLAGSEIAKCVEASRMPLKIQAVFHFLRGPLENLVTADRPRTEAEKHLDLAVKERRTICSWTCVSRAKYK